MDNQVKFLVWSHGDRTVGDYGSQAEVLVSVPDGMKDFIREQLSVAFQAIWNDKVCVMTDDEIGEGE